MLSTRIAAGATALVLGLSGVALANADLTGETQTEAHTDVSTSSTGLETETETRATISVSSPSTAPSTTSVTSATTSTTSDVTSTTIDDEPDSDDQQETRSIVSLDLNTYTVGDAGTVTVNGMAIVAIDANPGWTVEIDEASADKIKIEFENGEQDLEFELRIDGELRIKSGS